MNTRHMPKDADDTPTDPAQPRLRRRGDGTEYLLHEETLVGRGLECDILISDSDSISRRHAQVERDAHGLFVTDLGSTNGTHLNGNEITERTALSDGDVLAFDEYEFDVVIPPPPPDPEATRLVSRHAVEDSTMIRGERLVPDTAPDVHTDEPIASPGRPDPPEVPPPVAESADPPFGDAGDGPDLPRSVIDEMGDDRTWPDIDDDAREPIIEFSDEPSGTLGTEGGNRAPEPGKDALPAAAGSPLPGPSPAGPSSAEPRPLASAEAAPAPPAAADDAAGAPHDRGGAAAVPGAWANAADVQGAAGHTQIIKLPRRKAPPPIDSETLDGPALLVGTDDPAGEVLPLEDGITEWIVGSGADSDLYIDDDGVSKRHAVLSREGDKWRLCDELSANGTYVNGNRLNIGYVGDGDALRFGSVECRLAIPAGGRRGKLARGRAKAPRREQRGAGGQAARGGFPWKPVIVTLAIVLVLAIAATAFLFLVPRS